MSDKYVIAIIIAVAMGFWLLTGKLGSSDARGEEAATESTQSQVIPLVRGMHSLAAERVKYLEVRGQTRANRVVQVRAEIDGRVEAIPTVKGTQVKAGDLLCKLAVDTHQIDLDQAKASLHSAQLEYKGMLNLRHKGLQSEITLAQAKAALETSRAQERRAQLALSKTRISAPFDGVVDTQPVEVGDYLSTGQVCVSLMEINPMLVTGQVAEKNVDAVKVGDPVQVTLITGDVQVGNVTFVARAPDTATRTYPIEVTIDNRGGAVRAGLTSQMKVPVTRQSAHLISPASMVLSDEGLVGVRIVDAENFVRFEPVKVVSEGPKGVWVTGLPKDVTLITVGQEDVFDGQKVKVDLSPLGTIVSS